ncbi:MAG: VacJ family lipoprotein [Pseudomonadota bacterium]|nr:VacJ family lipoprotein [Pseudomonadota bacterium]
MSPPNHSLTRAATAGLLLIALGGCATTASGPDGAAGATAATVGTNPVDPWENWNRKVYRFNDAVDKAVLKPVAETYRDVVPKLVRTGVNNFFGNLYDAWSAVNQLAQAKVHYGLDMGMRVLTNTFFGLGGILDPATEMGLVRRSEDFGQTLGYWGVPSGPFVMLPLLGPSTVRDTGGLVVDRYASPAQLADNTGGSVAITGAEVVNTRTKLLETTGLVDEVALDRYSFTRDGYLAARRNAVYDGAPPDTGFDYSVGDAPAAAAAVKPGAAGRAPGAAADKPTSDRPAGDKALPSAAPASAPPR